MDENRAASASASASPRSVAPCLVKRFGMKGKESCTLYDIFKPDNQNSRESIPELIGTTIYHKTCHQGWLLLLCDEHGYDYTQSSLNRGDCFLWNPATHEKIQLPTLLDYCCCEDGYINDCILSSPPRSTNNTNPDNGNNDSIVLVFYQLYDGVHGNHESSFLFCRPGETQWRIHKLSPDIMDLISQRTANQSLLCFKGKLYLMCWDCKHIDEHLDYHLEIEHFIKDNDLTINVKSFHVKKGVLFPLVGGRKTNLRVQYVASHDELFRLDTVLSAWSRNPEFTSIEVVRLNFFSMEWEKVNSLGDDVLFVGCNTTGCCSAAELGFKSGCLYFVLHGNPSLYKFEIESTGNTVTLPFVWLTEFDYRKWVIMPVNVHRTVENMLGKDEKNDFSPALETKSSITLNDGNQGGNCKSREVVAASYWNNLNEDTVEVITNHLHGSDYKHFRSVCKANRVMIPKVQGTSYLSPWLVFSRDHNNTIYSVVNPMYNDEKYTINLSDLTGSTILFQKCGWLLMTRKENIFFYNPFTRETVKLPDMHIDRGDCYSVVSFTSLPTSSDCIVLVMDDRSKKFYIRFIRRGEAHWSSCMFSKTTVQTYVPFLDTAVFHDGAFFCVNYLGTVQVFSAEDNNWKVPGKPHEQFEYKSFQGYIVECAGDLLFVQVTLKYWSKKPVRIFKLNFSKMEWVEVDSLGEHTLFISRTSCLLVVAPNSDMKNKVYFPRLYLKDGGIVFYSLQTSCYHSVGSQHLAKGFPDTEGWYQNCTWIEPNMLKSTSQELDWLKLPS